MPEPFIPELFVGRQAILDQLQAWIDDPEPDQRVLSVLGPPGMGKSYLAHRFRDHARQLGRLVFWINLTRSPEIRGNEPDVVDGEGRKQWVAKAVTAACAHPCGAKVHAYDATVPVDSMLDALAADLCRDCADLTPLLIVDSFEEVDDLLRLEIEEGLLAVFARRSCTRVVIFRRDEYALQSNDLAWNERRLMLEELKDSEPKQQLQKRLDNWSVLAPQQPGVTSQLLTDLKLTDQLWPYQWNHPGLNTHLLKRAVQHHQLGVQPLITKEIVKECLLAVTVAVAAGGLTSLLSDAQFQLLVALASQFDSDWTERDLYQNLKVPIDDLRLKALFERGIVAHREKTARYYITPGLREMAKAWARLS